MCCTDNKYSPSREIHSVDRENASGFRPSMIYTIKLSIVRASNDGIMTRTDDESRLGSQDREDFISIRELVPFVRCSDVVRDGETNSVGRVLPITTAEHLVICSFPLEDRRAFDGVPTHSTFFHSMWIVNLPVIFCPRNRTRFAREREPVDHSIDNRSGSDVCMFEKVGGVEKIFCAVVINEDVSVNGEILVGQAMA